MQPQVILLNGPSSSGKSTLSRALQELIRENRSEKYEVVSIDDFMKSDPMETIYEDDVYEISGDMCRRVLEALQAGSGVIVDHVITSERICEALLEAAEGFSTVKVLITCSLEILRKREKERGNRFAGSAETSLQYLYPKDGYDLRIDSGETEPAASAETITEFLKNHELLSE